MVHQKRAEALGRNAATAATANAAWDGRPGTRAAATATARATLLLFLTAASTAIALALAAANHLAVLHLGAQTHLVTFLKSFATLVLLLCTHSITALAVLLAAALFVFLLLLVTITAVTLGTALAPAAAHHFAVLHLHRHDHLFALLKCSCTLVFLLGTHCTLLAALFMVALLSTAFCGRLCTIVSRHRVNVVTVLFSLLVCENAWISKLSVDEVKKKGERKRENGMEKHNSLNAQTFANENELMCSGYTSNGLFWMF